MNIKNRLIEFIQYKRMTIKAFEETCGMSNGYISSMRKGLGTTKLNNVLTRYPELNREWLLYGEGTMTKIDASAQSWEEAEDKEREKEINRLKKELSDLREMVAQLQEDKSNLSDTVKSLSRTLEAISQKSKKKGQLSHCPRFRLNQNL